MTSAAESRRWILTEHGFQERTVTLGQPRANEVLIDVAAFGINRLDTELARRFKSLPADTALGLEVSGTVAAVGTPRPDLRVGDRVMALVKENGYSDRVVAPAQTVLKVPDGVAFEQAAAFPEALFTSWLNLVELGKLKAGETVLIHQATGGVGLIGAQLVKALGASVRVTTARPEALERLKRLSIGAALVEQFDRDPGSIADGGFDVILDSRGAGSFEANLRILKAGGRLVLIDSYSGEEAKIDIGRLLDNSLSVHGSLLRPRSLEQQALTADGIRARALPLIEQGKVSAVVDQVFQPSKIAEAHERLLARRHFGKLVVSVRG